MLARTLEHVATVLLNPVDACTDIGVPPTMLQGFTENLDITAHCHFRRVCDLDRN
jgi:hypothetical protein